MSSINKKIKNGDKDLNFYLVELFKGATIEYAGVSGKVIIVYKRKNISYDFVSHDLLHYLKDNDIVEHYDTSRHLILHGRVDYYKVKDNLKIIFDAVVNNYNQDIDVKNEIASKKG